MEASKEIRVVNPHQEIIFASAYLKETLEDSFKQLNQIAELLQKPFTRDTLIDTIENKEIYSQLQKFNAKTDDVKAANLTLEQLGDILDTLKRSE